jgi:hypothetical protein
LAFRKQTEYPMTVLRRTPPLLSALAMALILGACASAASKQITAGSFRLLPHQSVELGWHTTLAYDSYSDSRCPPDVKCIWAGALSYQFTLKGPQSSEAFALGPDRPEYTSPSLHGARIVLDKAAIPAAHASQAKSEPHAVTLTVSPQ